MANGSNYFPHDYNCRTDDAIKALIRKHGMLGYGIWWAIVEDLYSNANALRLDCEGIAYDLHVDAAVVKSVINDFGLFVIDGDFFGSMGVQKRIDIRNEKSAKASISAQIRWGDANALRSKSKRNAKKGKERENKGESITAATPDKRPLYQQAWESFEDLTTGNKSYPIWVELCQTPKWRKKGKSALTKSIEKLIQFTEDFAIELMNTAIANDYQGVVFNNTQSEYEKWLKATEPKQNNQHSKTEMVW